MTWSRHAEWMNIIDGTCNHCVFFYNVLLFIFKALDDFIISMYWKAISKYLQIFSFNRCSNILKKVLPEKNFIIWSIKKISVIYFWQNVVTEKSKADINSYVKYHFFKRRTLHVHTNESDCLSCNSDFISKI